ncbi:WD repeat-containing protein 93 [Pungitius pungitius]|uniref:WD repeat-containing protein 93 n=1 Tax=Pungitius pungitius TaxID=134920 RepID=UPI002E0E6692
MEITSIQMSRTAEAAYLLGTVDDMGVARVFAYHCEAIHPLSVINIMENINKRSICLTFELSEDGNYGAASMSCNGAIWLEIYQFPSEAWLKETEMALSQQQDENSSRDKDVKWSPVAALIKLKPPKIPAATALDGSLGVFKMTDILTHCLALEGEDRRGHQWDGQGSSRHAGKTREKPRRCTHHFLLPCGPFPGESKAKVLPVSPVAVCVWWSGSHNLLQYMLQKAPKNKTGMVSSAYLVLFQRTFFVLERCNFSLFDRSLIDTDVEPTPDVLWPNAKEILCSAVSRCSRHVALGLDGALVCVWDRQSGSPLSIVDVSAADRAFFRMQFVDNWPEPADVCQTSTTAKVCLLLLCKSGEMYTVTAGGGTRSCTVQLSERPKDSADLPTVTASVPFLQSLSLVVQRKGKMFLQDVINRTNVCSLILPKTHRIATPCNPVYALNPTQQTLFIQGDQESSSSASSEVESQSQLFIFRLGEHEIIKRYIVSLPDSPQQLNTLSCVTLEETCNLYLQQRAQSVDERNKALRQTWKRLQETAVRVQQRNSKAAAS